MGMTLDEMEPLQRAAYNRRYAYSIAHGERPNYDDAEPEEKAAVCIKCGDVTDPEMPFDEGVAILCGGNYCEEEDA